MKLTVVRHGQTNYNVLGLHNADPSVDVYLTPNGISEAKQVSKKLKNEPFDVIFVSELPRTKQTADYINEYHNLPIVADARLNDINSGFEGKPVREYHAQRDSTEDAFTYRYKDAESSEDVFRRTQDFLKDIKASGYNNVLVVTSKHNFRHFRSIIDRLDPRESLEEHIPNAEILVREIK